MEILKKVINGVNVTVIKTNKFKSIFGTLYFKGLVTKENVTSRSLLRELLIESCNKYNTTEKLYTKTLETYDSYYGSYFSRYGNYVINKFSFKTLEDKYTENGNLNEVIDIFCEIIFNPFASNKAFDKETFNMIANRRMISLDKIKENTSSYAQRRLYKNLNQKKPYTFLQEKEELEKLNPNTLYEEYENMINDSEVDLVLAGDIDLDSFIIEKITSHIKSTRTIKKSMYVNNDDEEDALKVVEESGSGTQNILQMICYLKDLTDYELNYVLHVYKTILGATSSSRLFNIIREENSLSYYSYARIDKDDSMMSIIMGIEKENYEKAKELTFEIVKSMDKVTDKEMSFAKKELISTLVESQDNISNLVSNYYNRKLYNTTESIEDYIEKLNKVTKDDVQNLAKKISINMCFFMKGDDGNE